MERNLYTARLARKECISHSARCFHFEFVIDELENFRFTPGQFVTAVAEDANGKEQTRAYSIASAVKGNRFDLCLNRVEDGFFSNRLVDLPVGGTIEVYGPNGFFTLREPVTDSILIATGTGIAPMRSFAQWLFPAGGPDRSEGKQFWLVYGTRFESETLLSRGVRRPGRSLLELSLCSHAEPWRGWLDRTSRLRPRTRGSHH